MECNKCHLIYKKEDTRTFTCKHIICNFCFCDLIIKELINSINDIDKLYLINCKCKKGNISFNLEEIKKIQIPLNSQENNCCSIHKGELYTHYDKTIKKLLCKKCIENEEYKDHEKTKISDLKLNIKERNAEIKYKTYEEFKKYLTEYLNQFIKNCNEYYQEEIKKMEIFIEKIKNYEQNLKAQMEDIIQKEKILFNLIDKIYEKNYQNLKIFNEGKDIYGYRFYKLLSKVKFNFGEFGIEYEEEIIPEIENMFNEFDKNVLNKKYKVNIKYPYFELIKQFSKIDDIKQESIISCITENKNNNEIFIGFRDYTINVLHPKNTGFEMVQTLKSHKGEITSLLYIDNYLISGSKDHTIKIWQKDNDNIYKIKQVIKLNNEIKKINKYINDKHIGFLVTSEENNFRLYLKKENEEINIEEEKKEENEQLFIIEQVLSDHDNEVNEAIQIKSNNDIISGSKDMTIIIWKDFFNSLQYECNQIISAGNEVTALCPFCNKGFAFAINGSYDIKIYDFNFSDGKYEEIGQLSPDFCHNKVINQIILLKDNRLCSCSYDSTVKIISYNSLTKEMREDQELDEQNLSVNAIIETGNGKLISGGHGKHLMIYKRN